MEELKRYVDSMFNGYSETLQVRELKKEIFSNLKARVEDLAAGGMDYPDAVNKAKDSITEVHSLIDGNTRIYINKYKLEYMQIILMHLLAAWIITIPMRIIGMGILLNFILMVASLAAGAAYGSAALKKDSDYINSTAWRNIRRAESTVKWSWALSILFILFNALYITALQFGSNIWFARPVHIDGPYQFASIAVRYLIPVLIVLIPVAISNSPKLILKYEVTFEDENKE